jgi:hypothetical protein
MSWIAWAITTLIMGWIIFRLQKQNDEFSDRLMCRNYGEYLLARKEQVETKPEPQQEEEEPVKPWSKFG